MDEDVREVEDDNVSAGGSVLVRDRMAVNEGVPDKELPSDIVETIEIVGDAVAEKVPTLVDVTCEDRETVGSAVREENPETVIAPLIDDKLD